MWYEKSQEYWNNMGYVYHNTNQIINAINKDKIADKIMFTTHPQRWNNNLLKWLNEFIIQKIKNVLKFFLLFISNRKSKI